MTNTLVHLGDRQIDPADAALGATIRCHRKAKGISLETLGVAVGVTYQQVQKYETGANRVSFSQFVRIAKVLDLQPGELADQAAGTLGFSAVALPADAACVRLGRSLSELPQPARGAALRSCQAVISAVAGALPVESEAA